MKNIVSTILVVVFCVSLFGCSSTNAEWRSINIQCGTIKIPKNWSVSYTKDLMYCVIVLLCALRCAGRLFHKAQKARSARLARTRCFFR